MSKSRSHRRVGAPSSSTVITMDDVTLNHVAPRLLENAAEWDQRDAHGYDYRHAEAQTQRDLYYYMLGREHVMPPEWTPVLEHVRETENDPEWTLYQLLDRKMRAKSDTRPHKKARMEYETHAKPQEVESCLLPRFPFVGQEPERGREQYHTYASLRLRILNLAEDTHKHAVRSKRQGMTITFRAYKDALDRTRALESQEGRRTDQDDDDDDDDDDDNDDDDDDDDDQDGEDGQQAGSGIELLMIPSPSPSPPAPRGKKRAREPVATTPLPIPIITKPPARLPSAGVHPELRLQSPKLSQLQRLVNKQDRYPWMARNMAFTTEAQRARNGHVETYLTNTFRNGYE